MTLSAPAEHLGMVHEAAFYSSDEEFLGVVVPFLQGGLETGALTVVALGEQNIELVRSAMPDTSHLSFMHDHYLRPASAIKSVQQLLTGQLSEGARQIRILGEVPQPGVEVPWEWWARYEATVNHAFDEFPLWALCPYDSRITSSEVLDDVAQTHPYLATADGRHIRNDRYTHPEVFLTQPRPTHPDPLEETPPLIGLIDPTPLAARQAVREISPTTCLTPTDIEGLVVAVCEAVTNAICHGRPPVQLRLWAGLDRIVVTVTDHGAGPTDPFVGLLPVVTAPAGGLGLWLTHQLCSLVTLDKLTEGFTIRLIGGKPIATYRS
jgi:anti-sigma regulatory factor (Ser/Thr protein kinase)